MELFDKLRVGCWNDWNHMAYLNELNEADRLRLDRFERSIEYKTQV